LSQDDLGIFLQNLIPIRGVEHWKKNYFPEVGMLKFTYIGNFFPIQFHIPPGRPPRPSIGRHWPIAPPSARFCPTRPSVVRCNGGKALNVSLQWLL
jgi:hypothetical protein